MGPKAGYYKSTWQPAAKNNTQGRKNNRNQGGSSSSPGVHDASGGTGIGGTMLHNAIRGRARMRCLVSSSNTTYGDVITPLLDVDALPDWNTVSIVDLFIQKDKPPTCGICLQEGNQIAVPRISKCGHYFCYLCITRYLLRDEKTGMLQDRYCEAAKTEPLHYSDNTKTLFNHNHQGAGSNGKKAPARKCPVCKLDISMNCLRPVRFQMCCPSKNVKRFALMKVDPEICGGIIIPDFCPPSREVLRQGNIINLPHFLPRESIDFGWHFSKLVVVDEKIVEDLKINDVLGLIQQAWHIRKNPGGLAGDTESLPFLDVLIGQELVLHGCKTKEEFIKKNTLPTASAKREEQEKLDAQQRRNKMYDNIVYNRQLNTVQLDLEAEFVEYIRPDDAPKDSDASGNEQITADVHPDSSDHVRNEPVAEELVIGGLVMNESKRSNEQTDSTTATTSDQKGFKDSTNPSSSSSPSKSPQKQRNSSHSTDDEWHAPRQTDATVAALKTVHDVSTRKGKTKSSNASSGASAYHIYQSWDGQSVFIAPFLMRVLEYEYGTKLPPILDIASKGKSKQNSKFHYQDSITITEEQRRCMALAKRLPLYLEIDLVEFDVFPFIGGTTKSRFKTDFDKRRRQHQQEDARKRWDEEWVDQKAKAADEKYVQDLKERSWMNVQPINTSVPKAEEDFNFSLFLSQKIADHEQRTKKKITDEDLAVLISLEEERVQKDQEAKEAEKKRVDAEKKRKEDERIQRQNMRKAGSTSARGNDVVDAWSSDEDAGSHNAVLGKLGFEASASNYQGASSSSYSSKPVKSAWVTGTATETDEEVGSLAEKLRQQKLQEAERKKKEEADKSYFPSLAEVGMVSMNPKKGTKKNRNDLQKEIFGTSRAASTDSPAKTLSSGAASPPTCVLQGGISDGEAKNSTRIGESKKSDNFDINSVTCDEAETGHPSGVSEETNGATASEGNPTRETADSNPDIAKGKTKKKKPQKIQLYG